MDPKLKQKLYDLIKTVLPKLHGDLKKIWKDGDLEKLPTLFPEMNDINEIFNALQAHYGSDVNQSEEELDDQEAMKLMQGIAEDEAATNEMLMVGTGINSTESQEIDSPTEPIDDEEAKRLLAEMDAPIEQNSDSMDDDEARKLLAEMDAPIEQNSDSMDDDEARKLLAEMDAPIEQNSDSMDDDEARKLLAEMDAPIEQNSDSMDDDEARKLLAEMDAPIATSVKSADDEAAALLAQLGGEDENDFNIQPQTNTDTNTDKKSESVEEIDEFGGSEFASDPEMMKDFITNSDEIMENLDEQILLLESDPTSKEVIEEIFRAAHTLKGAAGMFGFLAIERIMHRMENYFDLIRKEKMQANPDAIDLILEALDMLKTLIDAVREGSPSGIKTAPMVTKLNSLCDGNYKKSASSEPVKAALPSADAPPKKDVEKSKKQSKKDVSTIRVDLERLDVLVNLIGELVIDRTRFMNIEQILRTHFSEFDLTSNMSETVQLFGRHMNQIQDIIMKVRMVPIGNAFNKFTRIVRDIARQLDKDIQLNIFGETTELDKTLVEQIGDPLVHLIRNACDHGAQTMSERQLSGKKGPALIDLSARQEGNHIIISIEDDGKGMDPQVIRNKAIEKGLISEQDVLSDKEIFSLIFEPGFSTAAAVTNISGRGVGMDVVKKQITKLKGIIEIDSTPALAPTLQFNCHLP